MASAWPASPFHPLAPGECATRQLPSRLWGMGPEGSEWPGYLIALVALQPKTNHGQVILCHTGDRGGNGHGVSSLSLNSYHAPGICRCLGVTVHRLCLQRTLGLVGENSKLRPIWHLYLALHLVGAPTHDLFKVPNKTL